MYIKNFPQECINSLASDDHTGMDSFHECLQEYGEGLEVVQICLEPEESSIKDEEVSALCDISFNVFEKGRNKDKPVNGLGEADCKSNDSLDDHEDDMTITEDDVLVSPRELQDMRQNITDSVSIGRPLSKQQSKDISTSDEMVFAVTPTGLERISFEKYWKECDTSKDETDLSNKGNNDVTISYNNVKSVQENSNLLFIDHEIDGYETCLEDDSNSAKLNEKTDARKIKELSIKVNEDKHSKINVNKRRDSNSSAKSSKKEQTTATTEDDESSYGHPYVQEHIIKQMQSLRIEPINVNIGKKKKKSPTKPSNVEKRKCIEYYNDQAECLEEYRRQKQLEEEEKQKNERYKANLAIMEKKLQMKKQEPSEESTDLETFVPGCHKCFLENFAFEIKQAYIAEAESCKYCAVIREMFESSKILSDRRMSAPAFVSFDSATSESDVEDFLAVPIMKDRRRSAEPLKFPVPSRRLRLDSEEKINHAV